MGFSTLEIRLGRYIHLARTRTSSHRNDANPLNRPHSLLSSDNQMTTQGLIGFRYREKDRLIYNHADSDPDRLGLKILKELRGVDNWDAVRKRVKDIVSIPETRKLDEHSTLAETELRRHFPNLEYTTDPKDYYQLYRPLQGSLKSYLDGKLMFMPDASDFIYDSLHCEWAYIANLDTDQFEVWKGNQLEPAESGESEVWKGNPPEPTESGEYRYGLDEDRMGYYPCAMVKSYDLNELPNPGLFLTYYSFSGDLSQRGK